LEGCTEAKKTSLLDVGYTALEDRYNAAKVPKKVYSAVNVFLWCIKFVTMDTTLIRL